MKNLLVGLDGLLVTDPTNIRYLTGFVSIAPNEREAYLLITQRKRYLFTHALYLEQAKTLSNIKVEEIPREEPFSNKLSTITKTLDITRLGFEQANLIVSEFTKLEKELAGIILVPTGDRVENMRMIKRPDEIKNIRQAARITDQCFEYILQKLVPGLTEQDIAWEIETFFQRNKATNAFSPTVAFGAHSSQPHYQPNNSKLTNNQIILLDFGARVNGYCSDMTRVVFLGKPKEEWKRAYTTVCDAQKAALDYLSSTKNPSGAKADEVAQNIIAKADFPPYPHSLGHNVGLDIHETPRLSMKADKQLKAGMIFSVEPGIYMEGQFGIRIEDLVLQTDQGPELLSHAPKKIVVL